MVIMDKEKMSSFQKPYRTSSKSKSMVVTLPKAFTDILNIDTHTRLLLMLDSNNNQVVIKKIEESDLK